MEENKAQKGYGTDHKASTGLNFFALIFVSFCKNMLLNYLSSLLKGERDSIPSVFSMSPGTEVLTYITWELLVDSLVLCSLPRQ